MRARGRNSAGRRLGEVAETLFQGAVAARRAGDVKRAEAHMRALLAVTPDHPALPNAGLLSLAAGNPRNALVWSLRGVRLSPTRAEAWNILGDACRANGLHPLAMVAWATALALDPALPEALGNMANLLRDMERAELAETTLDRACRANPTHPGLLTSRVRILQGRHRDREAFHACRAALALAPAFADAWCDMGLLRRGLDGAGADVDAAAERAYDHALRVNPLHAQARFNGAMLALEKGDENGGWHGYAARFAAGQARPHRRFVVPEWTGQSLRGKSLLVWREQGVGDEILLASRYRPLIARAAAEGGAVVIECEARLASLFARSFPGAAVRAERRADSGPPNPHRVEGCDCDLHVPAGSLPALFRRPMGGNEWRWLFADPTRETAWRESLDGTGPGLRVGIAWRSLLATLNRIGAYAPLAAWEPILTTPGVTFVNLQLGRCEEEIAVVRRRFGATIHVAPRLDLKDDFENTSALISALDLVIAPAVAVAELSGALGVPTWRFGRRDWTQLGTAVRPWSPATRVFRPGAGRPLSDALDQIGSALRRSAATHAIGRDLSVIQASVADHPVER